MSRAIAILSGYGALELKRAYRKNMIIGTITACLLNLAVIGAVVIFGQGNKNLPVDDGPIKIHGPIELGDPPPIGPRDNKVKVAILNRQDPSVGVPVPVPDDEAPEDVEVATMDDLASMATLEPLIDLDQVGDREIVIENIDDLLPSPDEFVAYEEMPEIIENVSPVYPPMAQKAGITGVVWVKALIDKDGKVRNVIIVKGSGAQAGFEEAAVEAAYKTVWKPAISNGQPVAVWTTYRIFFKFK